MLIPEQFDFDAYEDRPTTPHEVAHMLPSNDKYFLSSLIGADELTCTSTFILMGAEKRLAEFGVINARTREEQRQEAWDVADWDTVDRIDEACKGLGEPKDFLDLKLTPFGIEVIAECYAMNPPAPKLDA